MLKRIREKLASRQEFQTFFFLECHFSFFHMPALNKTDLLLLKRDRTKDNFLLLKFLLFLRRYNFLYLLFRQILEFSGYLVKFLGSRKILYFREWKFSFLILQNLSIADNMTSLSTMTSHCDYAQRRNLIFDTKQLRIISKNVSATTHIHRNYFVDEKQPFNQVKIASADLFQHLSFSFRVCFMFFPRYC